MKEVYINHQAVGDGHPCYLIGEIGINHNGNLEIAKNLISVVKNAGWDAVKFQKRTVEIVYTPEELAKPRETPFGETNGDLKHGLEFGLRNTARSRNFAKSAPSPGLRPAGTEPSVDFIEQFPVPCYKIASASLTDDDLLLHTRATGKPILLSTGMSTYEEIDHAIDILGKEDLILLHTCSAYPAQYAELNLRMIPELRARYGLPVGYSGHETGIASSVAAVALGACVVERHITLDRSMWGSDQAASLEPSGTTRVARDIRLIEASLGDGVKRVSERETAVMKKLRRVGLKV